MLIECPVCDGGNHVILANDGRAFCNQCGSYRGEDGEWQTFKRKDKPSKPQGLHAPVKPCCPFCSNDKVLPPIYDPEGHFVSGAYCDECGNHTDQDGKWATRSPVKADEPFVVEDDKRGVIERVRMCGAKQLSACFNWFIWSVLLLVVVSWVWDSESVVMIGLPLVAVVMCLKHGHAGVTFDFFCQDLKCQFKEDKQ